VQAFDATLLRSSDLVSGTGISISGTTITNAAPDQTVALTQGANVTITGTYPNFTIASSDQFTGTVTSVAGAGTVNGLSLSGTVTSSGNITLGGTFSATVSEISDLTATAAELNLLDGVTSTTAELNYLDITTLGTSQASKVVTADANGVTTFDGGIVEDETAVTSTTNATAVNCRDGNVFTHVLTENTTFTFSNPPASGRAFAFTLKLVQDASASGYTVTWPASIDWPAATAPTLTATASAVDVFVFYTHDGGTNWYGFVAGQAMGTPA